MIRCRFCQADVVRVVLDLGLQPASNALLSSKHDVRSEQVHPLVLMQCDGCGLVQIDEGPLPTMLFPEDYVYFSSYSTAWLKHAEQFAAFAKASFSLGSDTTVVELASNDGYLLQFFKRDGIPVLGIDPAAQAATAAKDLRGVPTLVEFFGAALAQRLRQEGVQPSLVVANNVLAHVPSINDFVAGIAILLRPGGVASIEVPHLHQLVRCNQFDTVYHEHFFYFSLHVLVRIMATHGLTIVDVQELPTHGGSLRLFVRPVEQGITPSEQVMAIVAREQATGLAIEESAFAARARAARDALCSFLDDARARGRRVAAYGAPAKGNTLLNFCNIGPDLIPYTVDANPHKQGKLLPGSHIPVFGPQHLRENPPDDVLILPWNLKDEILQALSDLRDGERRFVLPIPMLEITV